MRKLTIAPRLGKASIELLENTIHKKLPKNFSDFLIDNAGLSHLEYIYYDKFGTRWEVSQYNQFKDLYGLTEEFLREYQRKLVPFAYDPGGWHFCLCMDDEDLGAIYINRWTDHLPHDQFLKIAESFEDFINGLQSQN